MKRQAMKTIALALLLAAAAAAPALEVGFDLSSSNLRFPWDWTAPLPAATTAFPADAYFWGGEAWISESMGEDAEFRISYERDPVLRNSVAASVDFERGIARIVVGPRVGLFNSAAVPFSAGLSSTVRLQWPGVAYVSMRSDGGLSVGVLASGADPQARVELAAGLYSRNAIVSALVQAKRFNDIDASGAILSTDSWTRYALAVDVFKKNVPYTFLGTVGYELRSKRYTAEAATDGLGAVVLGAQTGIRATRALTLTAGLDAGFYVFGLDELRGRGPSTSSFMFSAKLGMSVDLNAVRDASLAARAAREAEEARAAAEAEAKAAAGAIDARQPADQPPSPQPASP